MEPLIAMKGGTTEKPKRRREETMVNQEGGAAGMLGGLTFRERSVSEPPWKEYPRQCSVSWGAAACHFSFFVELDPRKGFLPRKR